MEKVVVDDLEALLERLPPGIAQPIWAQENRHDLLEVILDLGRPPEARYLGVDTPLRPDEVTEADINYVVSRIGDFGDDNRAGIERTLHRISAIRNRKGRVVGLTCRVGRAVFGTMDIIRDLVESGKSILLLGRPGVGKTTMLREVARVLADDLKKRVIIVDTSNEIAGDGDIPHPAIGHARRMQVPTPDLQHAVMIEAVENHMPEVIIIDEIGTELEASAARTIAERGVQLVATAHGNTLENLILNQTLADLIGGIQTVTLGDEEARRRGTQKSILERKAPPTFHILVEIQNWGRVGIHQDVAATVDGTLRGEAPALEVRSRDEAGQVHVEQAGPTAPQGTPSRRPQGRERRLFPFGVSRERLEQAARNLQIPVGITRDLREADLMMTSPTHYRRRSALVRSAETRGVPIYVLRSNTVAQMEESLASLYEAESLSQAIKEAETAVQKVMSEDNPVELSPQNAYIRRLQHQLADRYHLNSRSQGREPHRRVTIFKEHHR